MQEDIQQAAVRLFNELGEKFTLDQLQACTGLSRATLYRRIGSKEALLNELFEGNLIHLDDSTDIGVRVFTATRRIVAEYGFLASTMEQIAQEAGIGIATLYRHFKDKENLLGRFVEELGPKLVIRQPLESRSPDIGRDLRQIIEIGLRFGHHNQDIARIIFSMKPAERKYLEALRHDSASAFYRLVQYLEKHQNDGVLRDDVSAEDLAMTLNGFLVQYSVFAPAYLDRPLDLENDRESILRLFLQCTRRAG